MTLQFPARLAALLCLSILQTSCLATHAAEAPPVISRLSEAAPGRVLFVGNSYLYYNDSLHNHVRRIVEENGPVDKSQLAYKSATIGGASLSHHGIDSLLEPGRLGIDAPFDLVILQGGSGEVLSDTRRATFAREAAGLNRKIRATGAETALYMIHAYVEPHEKYDPAMIDKIRLTYQTTGNEIGALIIPVGIAFQKAYEQRPTIQLHKAFDGSHPSLLGTYLAACVVYASIYEQSPVGIDYDYFGAVDRDDADFLQRVAQETVREFFGRD